ncbi:hydroxyacylglutathione hydrolase [Rhizomicrobium electricum]|uniref:Hydroxyacylglutathione hydrolase n=1 Tax=Rhizomicrobium electricum TaxID=480070 RepID=A0ABN1F4A4_9PROT|nr:hydroxyacylglutathione hydrolase [Rhizomicrobium electricum]NIJ49372.1 hydroxyacylglutathione hydrolase [Rhizomicrobium electricum]
MPELEIAVIPCLQDNYAYLVRAGDLCAVIDPAEVEPIDAALKARGARLTHILNTHHHWDHSGGNRDLKAAYGAEVVGPEKDRTRIPAIDTGVDEEHGWRFGDLAVGVLEVPAHTRGAVAYVFGDAVFTGDTMFVMGCGRLFEGPPEMMQASLAKIAALPDDTKVYCGHEYTLTNARFALSLEPGNTALQERFKAVEALRTEGKFTVPSTIGLEKATNPFLRTRSAEIRTNLGLAKADDVAVFAEIRRRKDNF